MGKNKTLPHGSILLIDDFEPVAIPKMGLKAIKACQPKRERSEKQKANDIRIGEQARQRNKDRIQFVPSFNSIDEIPKDFVVPPGKKMIQVQATKSQQKSTDPVHKRRSPLEMKEAYELLDRLAMEKQIKEMKQKDELIQERKKTIKDETSDFTDTSESEVEKKPRKTRTKKVIDTTDTETDIDLEEYKTNARVQRLAGKQEKINQIEKKLQSQIPKNRLSVF